MSAIYYGLYEGSSPLSWYIRVFNWSRRSHAAAFRPPVGSEWGNVIEAWRRGVTEQHWTKKHDAGTVIDVYRVPCTQHQADVFYRSMAEKKGCGYDFLGVIGFGLRMNIGSRRRWFCSEAVFDSALMAGIILLPDIQAHKVYPGLLDLVHDKEHVARLVVPGKEG